MFVALLSAVTRSESDHQHQSKRPSTQKQKEEHTTRQQKNSILFKTSLRLFRAGCKNRHPVTLRHQPYSVGASPQAAAFPVGDSSSQLNTPPTSPTETSFVLQLHPRNRSTDGRCLLLGSDPLRGSTNQSGNLKFLVVSTVTLLPVSLLVAALKLPAKREC